jgi:hypothetical protein
MKSTCSRLAIALTAISLVLVSGCGTGSHVATTTTTPAKSAGSTAAPVPATTTPYAVIVHNFLTDGGPTYTVALVGADGRTAATVNAAKRSAASWFQVSSLSTSSTRVYYLDGNADVRYLKPNGSGGLATHLSVPTGAAAAFAVSPDDSRIAVSISDITHYPATTGIYVQDLAGGGNRIDLLKPTTALEWPIGWHNGRVVVAFGLNVQPQNYFDGFTWGQGGYQVRDATTGQSLADVCKGLDAFYPPVAGGTTCVNQPTGEIASWSGTATPEPVLNGCAQDGALSPDGSQFATVGIKDGCGANGASTISLVRMDGRSTPTLALGVAEGWLDAGHLVTRSFERIQAGVASVAVYDIAGGTSTPIQASGFFAGALPGGL